MQNTGVIVLLTILIWGIYYLITWVVGLALGIGLDWIGIGVILIFTSLAIAVPAAPSAIGTYHAAAIYVLTELFFFGSFNISILRSGIACCWPFAFDYYRCHFLY